MKLKPGKCARLFRNRVLRSEIIGGLVNATPVFRVQRRSRGREILNFVRSLRRESEIRRLSRANEFYTIGSMQFTQFTRNELIRNKLPSLI